MHEKIGQFRDECQRQQTRRQVQGGVQLIVLGFALYGGYKALEELFGDKD
jgi:hypothetical protein